jgi:hypothetical protein
MSVALANIIPTRCVVWPMKIHPVQLDTPYVGNLLYVDLYLFAIFTHTLTRISWESQ